MIDMLVIMAIVDVDWEISKGITYDRIYSGAELWAYQSDDVSHINLKISTFLLKPDSILSMYMIPAIFCPDVPIGEK